jgi:hypothetical protein
LSFLNKPLLYYWHVPWLARRDDIQFPESTVVQVGHFELM